MNELLKAGATVVANVAEKLLFAIGGPFIAERTARAKAISDWIEFEEAQRRLEVETNANRKRELGDVVQKKLVELKQGLVDVQFHQQVRQIRNLKNILDAASQLGGAEEFTVHMEHVDDDWIYQWRSYAENISDEGLQRLWAHVLRSAVDPSSSRPSLLALDALRYFDKNSATAFMVICKRLSYSDRLLSDELKFLSPDIDLAKEIDRLTNMRLFSTLEAGATFVQLMGLTVNLQESVVNTEATPTIYKLTETGRELAASFADNWAARRKHYADMTAKNSDPKNFRYFEEADRADTKALFRNLARICVDRVAIGTHWASLRNFGNNDRQLCQLESTSTDPIKFFFESDLEVEKTKLSDEEVEVAEEFCAALSALAS